MQKAKSFLMKTLAAASLAALFPGSSPAQSIWLDRSHDKTAAVEFYIPNFTDEGISTSTWIGFLSVRMPLSDQLRFAGEMPFAHSSFESSLFFPGESQNTIGNPYLGLEIGRQGSPFFAEIGARAPLASEGNSGAALAGIITDFDRFEAFMPNTVPITGMLNYYHKDPSGFALRLRGGPSLLLYTDGDSDNTSDWFLGYSAQAGYETQRASVMAGVTGRANMSGDGDFGERSLHQFGANASMGFGRIRPGLHFRFPLDDDLKESLDFVFGANLAIQF